MNIQALQTLLSNPAAMSVESLERAHREESRTPTSPVTHTGHGNYVQMPPLPAKATVANDLESDLKNKLNISKTGVVGKHKGLNYQENKSIEEFYASNINDYDLKLSGTGSTLFIEYDKKDDLKKILQKIPKNWRFFFYEGL